MIQGESSLKAVLCHTGVLERGQDFTDIILSHGLQKFMFAGVDSVPVTLIWGGWSSNTVIHKKTLKEMWICQEFGVSFELPGFSLDFQLAGSEVFTFPTFRCVLFLPGRPRSFVIMLLPCSWKLHTKLKDYDMLYFNYLKKYMFLTWTR